MDLLNGGRDAITVFAKSRYRFEQQVAVLVGLLCVALIGTVIVCAIWIGRREASRLIGQDMAELAIGMATTLDQSMHDRFREMRMVAELGLRHDLWRTDPEGVRAALETLQASLPAYTWIGFATPDGTVRAATMGMLEGASVAARPWFVDGLNGPAAGDVHEAKLLSALIGPREDGEPFRIVDVAIPVLDRAGEPAGVLGAHMSWEWADEVRRRLLSATGLERDTEIWILSAEGRVLLGNRIGSVPYDPARLEAMRAGRRGAFEEGDAEPVLTGYAVTSGFEDVPGLGWTVVVRRPTRIAFAPVETMVRTMVLMGSLVALFGVVMAWLVAHRAGSPLRELTLAARRIGRDPNTTTLPRLDGSREFVELSASLRSLLRRVGDAEQERFALEAHSRLASQRFREEIASLRHVADSDPLTGLPNRRAFLDHAAQALACDAGSRRGIAILVADIDHFKRVNDQHGHAAGDAVIRAVGRVLDGAVRRLPGAGAARFGGEEFVLILRESDEEGVHALAEGLREAVRATLVPHGKGAIAVTVSIGAALMSEADPDIQALIERADQALYEAKGRGRNCVSLHAAAAGRGLAQAA